MRLIRYLKNSKLAVLAIALLLIVQAYTDLALPKYTSDIVDTGIQQSGVEHPAMEELSANTFENIAMLLSEDDEARLRDAYHKSDAGSYVRQSDKPADIEELDSIMALPMAVLGVAAQSGEANIDELRQAYDAGALSKQDIQQMLDQALSQADDLGDSIIEQQAIAFAQTEYEQLGYDLSEIQTSYLWSVGLRMLALAALGMVVAICVGYLAARTGAGIGANLRKQLYDKVLSFSHAEVQRFSPASLITRGTNDIQMIQMVEIMLLRMVLYAPILATGGIIMVATTNVSMGWVIALAVVAVFLIIALLMAIAMPKFKIMQYLVDNVNRVAREILTGLPVIRAFNRQKYEQERFDEANTELMKTQLFTNRVMTFMMPAMTLIMNGVSVAIVWVGGHYVDTGAIQTGDLIAFLTYSMVVIMSFLIIGMISIMLPRADVAAQRIDEVLGTESSIIDPVDPAPTTKKAACAAGNARSTSSPAVSGVGTSLNKASSQTLPTSDVTSASWPSKETSQDTAPVGAQIEFKDVSFRYSDGAEYVLEHVSFTAPAGKTTAIIGSTGSGKTSICRLIERFYDVSEGAVLFNGVDVRDIPQHELRQQIGFTPQKAFLFSGTVASNVTYADSANAPDALPDANAKAEADAGKNTHDAPAFDEEQVIKDLSIAQALDFVKETDEGFAHPISQGGTNVSGGQRQRLAIARALHVPAKAYLFDDSFSALDYRTESALRAQMEAQLSGRTVLLVSQRIATVMHADVIVVLDEGRVVGTGTHSHLLETCPEYREIAESQLSPAELEGGATR